MARQWRTAGHLLGVPARIFLPEHPNPVKAGRIRELGAVLVETGRDLTAAIDAAEEYVTATGAFFLHDASSPEIPAGTATIGAEIWRTCRVSTRCMSDGRHRTDSRRCVGVAARVTAHPHRRCAAETAPAYYLSWKSGTVTETATADTSPDGLAVRRPLASNVAAIREVR
jgi:threonine dehydratase